MLKQKKEVDHDKILKDYVRKQKQKIKKLRDRRVKKDSP